MFTTNPRPPSPDKRWKIVEATMRRNGYQGHALIEALHSVQEAFGYLEPEGLRFVAQSLRVPLSQVYGAATFYHFFTMKPPGRHACVVCTGTACYINGAAAILLRIHDSLGLDAGGTTADGRISLLRARCLGACSMAPAVVVDDEVHGRISPDSVEQMLEAL